jgi:hypothetical protein
MGFGLVLGFTGLLQTVTTINYSAIANSHTLQFTTAGIKSYVCCVFSSRCLISAPKDVDSSASRVHVLTGYRPSHSSSWLQLLAIDSKPRVATTGYRSLSQASAHFRRKVKVSVSSTHLGPKTRCLLLSLMRGRVCRLQFMVPLASAVILGTRLASLCRLGTDCV